MTDTPASYTALVERALAEIDELERYGIATSRAIRPAIAALRAECEEFRSALATQCGKTMVAESRLTAMQAELEEARAWWPVSPRPDPICGYNGGDSGIIVW
ncbi:hypothetical protein EN866_35990, partial [Mesorhizobium sp. M2D.F.Ca.ET.223.01.1.1]|uniref:hypothetical protein n=1 Tax=Mesorhizobium sp. M2D.F.Ca.ET.223.01.1.1 TaxID=2563940 RepID=UPI0010929C87